MKYFLYTAQRPNNAGFSTVTGTISCSAGFFTQKEFDISVSDAVNSINTYDWNIIFLMEITKEQYEYYNK